MELFKSGVELDEDELEEIRDACELFESGEGSLLPLKSFLRISILNLKVI